MKNIFAWDADKNEKLQAERGLSFEVIVAVIEQRGVLDDIINPSVNFPDQRALVVEIDNYAILVPYVIDGTTTFLTAFQAAAQPGFISIGDTMKKPTLATRSLDDEERDLMAAFDQGLADGTLVSHLTPERHVELRQAATLTMNPPRKQISTRLPERDLVRLKAKALEQGVPYQSLLASIVHLYVEGALVEKDR